MPKTSPPWALTVRSWPPLSGRLCIDTAFLRITVLNDNSSFDLTVGDLLRSRNDQPANPLNFVHGGFTIGRRTALPNSEVFNSRVLSRSHAKLLIDTNGHVYITDVGSLHGTMIEVGPEANRRLPRSEPNQLRHGDVVVLGKNVSCNQETHRPVRLLFAFRFPASGTPKEALSIRSKLLDGNKFATVNDLRKIDTMINVGPYARLGHRSAYGLERSVLYESEPEEPLHRNQATALNFTELLKRRKEESDKKKAIGGDAKLEGYTSRLPRLKGSDAVRPREVGSLVSTDADKLRYHTRSTPQPQNLKPSEQATKAKGNVIAIKEVKPTMLPRLRLNAADISPSPTHKDVDSDMSAKSPEVSINGKTQGVDSSTKVASVTVDPSTSSDPKGLSVPSDKPSEEFLVARPGEQAIDGNNQEDPDRLIGVVDQKPAFKDHVTPSDGPNGDMEMSAQDGNDQPDEGDAANEVQACVQACVNEIVSATVKKIVKESMHNDSKDIAKDTEDTSFKVAKDEPMPDDEPKSSACSDDDKSSIPGYYSSVNGNEDGLDATYDHGEHRYGGMDDEAYSVQSKYPEYLGHFEDDHHDSNVGSYSEDSYENWQQDYGQRKDDKEIGPSDEDSDHSEDYEPAEDSNKDIDKDIDDAYQRAVDAYVNLEFTGLGSNVKGSSKDAVSAVSGNLESDLRSVAGSFLRRMDSVTQAHDSAYMVAEGWRHPSPSPNAVDEHAEQASDMPPSPPLSSSPLENDSSANGNSAAQQSPSRTPVGLVTPRSITKDVGSRTQVGDNSAELSPYHKSSPDNNFAEAVKYRQLSWRSVVPSNSSIRATTTRMAPMNEEAVQGEPAAGVTAVSHKAVNYPAVPSPLGKRLYSEYNSESVDETTSNYGVHTSAKVASKGTSTLWNVDTNIELNRPGVASTTAAEHDTSTQRPVKRQRRRVGETIGLLAIGAALGSIGTIAGLLQLAE